METVEQLILQKPGVTIQNLEINSTMMGKCKWLFVNGSEFNIPVSNVMEFLNSCQDGMNVSMSSGIPLSNMDSLVE